MIVGIPAVNRAEVLPDISLQCYRQTNFFVEGDTNGEQYSMHGDEKYIQKFC
jgi:hypothetical protein